MKILTWNIKGVTGIGQRRLPNILKAIGSSQSDIVTLQEITTRSNLWPRLRDGLREQGFDNVVFSGRPHATRKRYGNVIASRYPVALDESDWASNVPWQQLLARAVVEVPTIGALDIITAHIPNGSGNGWKKIETFEALAAYIAGANDQPRILTGDFNEPYRIDAEGKMMSYGQRTREEPTLEGDLTRKGEAHPRKRWDQGVLSVLDGDHLRHADFDKNGRKLTCTHITRGNQRAFDHILVSPHFVVADSGYEHGWRTSKVSDHSAVWAELKASG